MRPVPSACVLTLGDEGSSPTTPRFKFLQRVPENYPEAPVRRLLGVTTVQADLLAWGAEHRRDLPWRSTRDPWAVLVAEVMLQQTQVRRVVPRWTAFLAEWPTPAACAAAPLSLVLERWQGLGYPRRARNLWLTAQRCVELHEGVLPVTL